MTTIKYAASALLRRLGCFLFALSACDFARKTKEAPLRLPRAAAGEPPRSGVGTKIVYVIRHGESQWNTAQKRKDPLAMFGQFDHALTMRGVEQAEGLRSRIRSASRYSKARIELERAGIIYCSPLTRALQTALISLAAHPALRSDRAGVVLIPECRELCYPVAGFDSLRGQMGDGIASRAIRRARRVATLRSLGPLERGALHVDASATEEVWWGFESRRGASARLTSFMERLCTSEHGVLIVVGHSLFFQAIFDNFASDEVKRTNPLVRRLSNSKLKNAQMARLTLDCSKPLRETIVSAELCFDDEADGEPKLPKRASLEKMPRGGRRTAATGKLRRLGK